MKLDVTTKKGYNIACALRGPDAPPSTSWRLKYLLTAYIRFLAGIEGSPEATVRQAMLTEEEARLALQEATYWKAQNNKKLILSLQTREYYLERPDDKGSGFCDMYCHTFTGRKGDQLMAPLAMINREYVEELGGIDRRYICGQWDNNILMDYLHLYYLTIL